MCRLNCKNRDLVNDNAMKTHFFKLFVAVIFYVKTDYKNALYILKSEQNKYMSTVVIKQERHKIGTVCSYNFNPNILPFGGLYFYLHFDLETIGVCQIIIWWLIFEKKPKSIKAGNLNSCLSYLNTSVLVFSLFFVQKPKDLFWRKITKLIQNVNFSIFQCVM